MREELPKDDDGFQAVSESESLEAEKVLAMTIVVLIHTSFPNFMINANAITSSLRPLLLLT